MQEKIEALVRAVQPLDQKAMLAAETPMRMPVKEPGPTATAMASMSDSFKSVFFRMCSTMGIKVRLWVRPVS